MKTSFTNTVRSWKTGRILSRKGSLILSGGALLGVLLLLIVVFPFWETSANAGITSDNVHTTTATIKFTYDRVQAGAFPTIISYVTVQNDSGIKVSGLTKDNFIVHEDGVRELPITVEELDSNTGQLSIVMVMDISSSMEEEIGDAKKAATTFVSLANAPDRIALISFDKKVRQDLGFTQDKNLVINTINALQLGSGTAVYDATSQAYDLALTATGRRAIVLLTDGRDNSSTITLPALLQKLSNQAVPVYAIGLGLKPGKSEEIALRAIADTSGGLYYNSPTSQQLEEIYRAIALMLYRSNYRITYTTHNCTMDGTLRNVRIDVQYKGMTAFGTNKYQAPNHFVTLAAVTDSVPMPGRTFRVKIEIPATSNELLSLSELKLVLNYDSRYLKVKTPVARNVVGGSLFGATGEYTLTASDTPGALTLQLKRKAGLQPVKGRGVVAEVRFLADLAMPDSTQLRFELVNLDLRNAAGCSVVARPEVLTLYSNGLMVWPGDTNHNGKVELTDVLVLGLYWDMIGPARPGPEDQIAWMPHVASRYPLREATHADADGNGGIVERDLIPIGINWGKTATPTATPKAATVSASLPAGALRAEIIPTEQSGQYHLQLSFEASGETELAGITMRVSYPREHSRILSAEPGSAWPTPPLFVTNNKVETRTFALGIMVPAGAPIPRFSSGSQIMESREGKVVKLLVQSDRLPVLSDFAFKDVALVAADGKIREVEVQTAVTAAPQTLPETFTVYPAYPNPISLRSAGNAVTTWRYFLPEKAEVRIAIYNAVGQHIRSMTHKEETAGYHTLSWDGTDAQGHPVGSGLYFIGLEVVAQNNKSHRAMQKIAVVK
ncbi:MAG: VWA domain-containing protein [candidate division KSB1 bacterium]|nr:VWA domain-containing protein [candidate division KSB1 bacterium]MDZ7303052.1 VWA domain-containing protein [candidate division KSB1 bacterium]MDZ7312440.1 VWA domain-containing protein [candidate division KSB1 bacterium]